MSASIATVSLVVRDYDEAIRFYVDRLGFRLSEDADLGAGKRWVVVVPPGEAGCCLLLAKAKNETELAVVGNQAGGRVFLFLQTDDFARDHAAMKAQGVRFLEEPRHEPYGSVAVFEDLYGNKWDLLERKKTAQSLTYLPVTEADFEELLALRIAAMRESLERLGRFDPERARARLRATFESQYTFFITAAEGHVGFYACKPTGEGLSLDHLYVHPKFQGLGYGTIALKRITDAADRLGLAIKLGALKESASNRFYQRHGFRPTGESEWDNYYVREPKV